MIITKLVGGLGNQMFQYALGRHLALLNNTSLYLDITHYETDTLRKYELDCFDIQAKIADKKMLDDFARYPHHLRRWERLWQYHILGKRNLVIAEPHFHYSEGIIKKYKENLYLAGYWQSEQYFEAVETSICKDFTFVKPLTTKAKEFETIIKSKNSVSLHIRRGDYVSNTAVLEVHGVCSLAYYGQGINFIKQKIEKPTFFIFSDDIAWCKAYLQIDAEVIFIEDLQYNYEDLRLMSLCQHHIIANSSFSWWGAWLNPNPDKIVIAPEQWFTTTERDCQDIIPKTWIKI